MPYPSNKKSKVKYPWIGQVRVNGKRTEKLFASKKQAIQWESEERERQLNAINNPVQQEEESCTTRTISLADWATAYLSYAKDKFAFKTYDEKQRVFKLFFQDVDPRLEISLLKPRMVLDHLTKHEQTQSGNKANKSRKNLRAAWQWGIRFMDLSGENPFATVFKFAENREERYVPPIEDFWQVYEATEVFQDKLMLLTYLQTGARRDELFRLMWKDIDFENKQLRLTWRKNAIGQWNTAWLPIKDELIIMLRSQQKETGLLRFVFLNRNGSVDTRYWVPYLKRQHWMENLCEQAEVPAFGLHGIRHLFASLLAEASVPLVTIQKMLRHSSIATTARYIHSLKKENREVLDSLPDLGTRIKKPSESRPADDDYLIQSAK